MLVPYNKCLLKNSGRCELISLPWILVLPHRLEIGRWVTTRDGTYKCKKSSNKTECALLFILFHKCIPCLSIAMCSSIGVHCAWSQSRFQLNTTNAVIKGLAFGMGLAQDFSWVMELLLIQTVGQKNPAQD